MKNFVENVVITLIMVLFAVCWLGICGGVTYLLMPHMNAFLALICGATCAVIISAIVAVLFDSKKLTTK